MKLQKWFICKKTSFSNENTSTKHSVLLPLDAIPLGYIETKTYLSNRTTTRSNGEKESYDKFRVESTVIYALKKEIVDVEMMM